MISDESSSDSETGRFKCRSKTQEETKSSNKKDDSYKSAQRSRPSDNDRLRREFDRKRDVRDRYERRSRERERSRYPRHSPISSNSRRHSRDRSPSRRSREKHLHNNDFRRSKPKERSSSRDRKRSKSMSFKPSERRRDFKDEIKRSIAPKERSPIKERRRPSLEKKSSSPEFKGKRSEICKPKPVENIKKKVESPIVIDKNVESDSDDVQPGSYYSMIPAVVKEKSPSPESSEIDSSDDERLRAKLLNLEKELHRTRKKKHKKKHKKKSSRSSKDKEVGTPVEVTSTTDIQEVQIDLTESQPDVAEVTSTQKSNHKESSEEGEISSDDNSQDSNIDPKDLRHKLKQSASKDVCGPALPPHLEKKYAPDGPALPPHLNKMDKRLGPTIPENLRKSLAAVDQVIVHESSDEDLGIGPLPTGTESKWSKAHQQLEERALDIKIKKLVGQSEGSKVKTREEWMLELPEGKAKILGLEARGFRAKAGPDMSDRSSWTDTPEEKARKSAGIVKEEDSDVVLQREARAKHIANRDEEQEKVIKKHKKKHKRDESLLEMHQKKLKKKKKKEEKDDERKERRPFSRDVDLQANRFDEAQKQSIIKKAQGLNTRFSGGEAKYL